MSGPRRVDQPFTQFAGDPTTIGDPDDTAVFNDDEPIPSMQQVVREVAAANPLPSPMLNVRRTIQFPDGAAVPLRDLQQGDVILPISGERIEVQLKEDLDTEDIIVPAGSFVRKLISSAGVGRYIPINQQQGIWAFLVEANCELFWVIPSSTPGLWTPFNGLAAPARPT